MEHTIAWLIQWWELIQARSEGIVAIAAVAALIISIIALLSSFRSARAAELSVNADQIANALSQRSVVEAAMSNVLTQQSFENEFKGTKGRAYWALYRAHNVLDLMRYFDHKLADLAPVQDLLSVYGDRLPERTRECLRTALNGIELVVATETTNPPSSEYRELKQRVRPYVRDAAMSIKEDWMPMWPDTGEA